ncbi:unnamed protein product [Mytilus edulis]|uniref:Uncharacterized protein n=1 Tax=Mytilus edulis TaxID=6550 RepID=A0A8S3VLN0_MYTED|nr:unnamed protein product [Mytilus edulis]
MFHGKPTEENKQLRTVSSKDQECRCSMMLKKLMEKYDKVIDEIGKDLPKVDNSCRSDEILRNSSTSAAILNYMTISTNMKVFIEHGVLICPKMKFTPKIWKADFLQGVHRNNNIPGTSTQLKRTHKGVELSKRGEVVNSVRIRTDSYSRIACINHCKIAVSVPGNDLIEIVTIIAPTQITDLITPVGTRMTGGITCRMDILYVAFSDAIRLMDLSRTNTEIN